MCVCVCASSCFKFSSSLSSRSSKIASRLGWYLLKDGRQRKYELSVGRGGQKINLLILLG